ncbi:hypothetical protein [Planctomyces sp. SH-PL14]|uniref:hypothetical protein n=1 Tax=Planctomyces sp. SH-PL14 TaxID=1632864 RepID=UPI00078D6DF5|nr:hypothetical protein [Planctomyces sp. SH-PL14]AMV19968.1 hypothetical protein VT03_18870 [Planctomyces sp. SH-PL14]
MATESVDRTTVGRTISRRRLLAVLSVVGLVAVVLGLPVVWERFLRPLGVAEQKLVGRWVFAHSRRLDALVFEADRTWRYEEDRTPTREISCHIGPTAGRWRISGERLICDDPQWNEEIVTFVTDNEIHLGQWPYRRVP